MKNLIIGFGTIIISVLTIMTVAALNINTINQLDLEKLEDIIIKVAKKELKHIEILGLVLGAIIGVLQGVLVIFL